MSSRKYLVQKNPQVIVLEPEAENCVKHKRRCYVSDVDLFSRCAQIEATNISFIMAEVVGGGVGGCVCGGGVIFPNAWSLP